MEKKREKVLRLTLETLEAKWRTLVSTHPIEIVLWHIRHKTGECYDRQGVSAGLVTGDRRLPTNKLQYVDLHK
jgi:hypothetical protein